MAILRKILLFLTICSFIGFAWRGQAQEAQSAKKQIIVIGSGVSGLAAARRLSFLKNCPIRGERPIIREAFSPSKAKCSGKEI